MNAIKLLAEIGDTVTISRADLDALIDAVEDAEDIAAVRGHRAHEAAVGGYEVAKQNYYTIDEAKRLWAGESPVRIWREKRGMTQRALAEAADVSPGYLNEIEQGKKPGSVTAYRAFARVLGVAIEDLLGD